MMSPCLTRRFWRTTRFIRALPSSRSSSAKTIRTVSFLFFPLTRTVSPRKSWRSSMVLLERAITELSSLVASVTLTLTSVLKDESIYTTTHIKLFGFFFFLRIAVPSSFCNLVSFMMHAVMIYEADVSHLVALLCT